MYKVLFMLHREICGPVSGGGERSPYRIYSTRKLTEDEMFAEFLKYLGQRKSNPLLKNIFKIESTPYFPPGFSYSIFWNRRISYNFIEGPEFEEVCSEFEIQQIEIKAVDPSSLKQLLTHSNPLLRKWAKKYGKDFPTNSSR